MRFFICTLLFFTAFISFGQQKNDPKAPAGTKYTLQFPVEGDRSWFIADSKDQPISAPASIKEKSVDLPLSSDQIKNRSTFVLIEDKKTGNMAEVPMSTLLTKKSVTLADADFKYAAHVKVSVTKDNKPAYNVTVQLKDSSKRAMQSKLISNAAPYEAVFDKIALGKVTIDLIREGGKDSHEETIASVHTPALVAFTYPTTANVPTGEAAASPTANNNAQPAAAPVEKRSSGLGAGIVYILALIFAIVVLGGIAMLMKGNNAKVAAAMQKVGAYVPDPVRGAASTNVSGSPSAASNPIVPEGFCPFCGQKKDSNGNCACDLSSGTSASSSSSVSTGQPRLLGLQGAYAGSIFIIDKDLTSIGREPGNEITLDQDTTISRKHAQITSQAGNFIVTDFNSSNGTFVNDTPVKGEQMLRPGDTVQFGTSKFKFES